jgi:hypothetical protein
MLSCPSFWLNAYSLLVACIVLWLSSNCYLPLSPVAMLFLFFDSKQNSLHSYFPEAIVIFLLCHQFILAAQYLFWLWTLCFRSKPVNTSHFIAAPIIQFGLIVSF